MTLEKKFLIDEVFVRDNALTFSLNGTIFFLHWSPENSIFFFKFWHTYLEFQLPTTFTLRTLLEFSIAILNRENFSGKPHCYRFITIMGISKSKKAKLLFTKPHKNTKCHLIVTHIWWYYEKIILMFLSALPSYFTCICVFSNIHFFENCILLY